ncbi:ABC transporter permease [Microbacterium paludicola]|uniref:ABC transporter permease n=1 Tax=Microbacterium paludicola TaxID=300019 RepID=A0A4Y9FUN3_9MICO|nr:ABC transporter permease [Microbacterium paludicola]MBF0817047.1 ABC transporter permease [Microbacterium paludicola]TFU32242.1 ABC transporter permease [Microbacterium paludicola]
MSTPTTTRTTAARPEASLTPAQGVWLVAEREIGGKLRSRSFLISTAILLVLALGGILWSGFQAGSAGTIEVAATADVAGQLPEVEAIEVTEVADRAEAEALVADGEVEAALLPDAQSPTGVLLLADKEAPDSLVSLLSVAPTVELLDPDADGEGPMRYLLGVIFGVVFMMSAITFGSPISMSVIEEKQTRVIEILISAIPARVLLAGKVLGNTILAFGQILLLVAVAVVGLVLTGQTGLLQGLGAPLVWFAVFFVFGFLLLAAMFAAAGSLVSRQEDSGPTLTPVMYLTMIPYFLVLFLGDNPVAMTVMSYVPFSAPVAMPIRLFFGEATWWEPLLSLVILLASCFVVIGLGAKIYENSLLRMGARVKLKDALRG